MDLNHTHDAQARSWIDSANASGCDFPLQNLPYAVFRRAGAPEPFRGGVAIGDQVLDLAALGASTLLSGPALHAAKLCAAPTLNDFMAQGPESWRALRHALFELLGSDSGASARQPGGACLIPQADVEYTVPARIGDYTDFYTSIYHALNVGRLMRPDHPLTDNFQWLPIAYHGRASSIVVSGTPLHRPMGQSMPQGASIPVYGPSSRLDFELELGVFIGPGNVHGTPIPLGRTGEHIFGMCLLNDWSARDIQFWEMAPLGPFLGKNFCTSISPWIVTMEALAPYRQPFSRPAADPQPLAYLDDEANRRQGALDIRLSVSLETARQRAQGVAASRVSQTSFRHQYWTVGQMLAQHTMGGCNLQPGDLFGTGTISGPTPQEAGAIIELSRGGREPLVLDGGERRAFLEDGDAVILRGWCEQQGHARIGFGECRGEVLAAVPPSL